MKRTRERRWIRVKERTLYIILAVVLGAWVILPDPVPVVVDDILAAVGSAAAAITVFRLSRGDGK